MESRRGTLADVGVSGFWQDRPVLVTGATGLLGSWLTRRLIEAGADVTCIVRDWVPQSELVRTGSLDRVKVVRGDIRQRDVVERAVGEYEIDTVIHLAAQTIVGIANRDPISTFESNIQGTWNLLDACRRAPLVKAIVVASSDKAYGDQEKLPYSEDAPLQGQHPYDVSKSCADLISQMYAKTFGLPVAVTRCGNFYGGGDLNWNRVVPGYDSLDPARRAAGDSLRRTVHPRLFLCGRRRSGVSAAGRTTPRPARTARAWRSTSPMKSK